MFFRKKTTAGRSYLQIVESRRADGKIRQHIVATLGRFDELAASGQLERLLRSGARFAQQAMLLQAARDDPALTVATRRIGPVLVGLTNFPPYGQLKYEAGYLFGLTQAAARGTVRWRLEYEIPF